MSDDKHKNLIELIKNTPVNELQPIADMLRTSLIQDVLKTGGHLASNLGVVELTVALHKVFDSPRDKIIFDVGHQCYIHKMITGRFDELSEIRRIGCISGFPKRSESVHDMYDSGHSSTSISAALGYAAARDLDKDNYSCVAIIGDGALTGGVAYEALNHAGASNTPLIVILNDNNMSIGKSVGGTSQFLTRLRTSVFYNSFKNIFKQSSRNSHFLFNIFIKLRDLIKLIFIPDQIFECLGFKYYGPIDGHNIPDLVNALEFAKKSRRPILLHVVTIKGKGYAPAEEHPEKFHGISPAPDKPESTAVNTQSWSSFFGSILLDNAVKDSKIVAVSAAMIDATGLRPMQKVFPDRVFDVGIAEQHAVSFAAGMALNGYKPVVAVYSTFLQRAYDEILIEVCLQKLPIIFAIDRAGVTGSDGETHQGIFDISYLSSMPGMTILNAYDEASFKNYFDYALRLNAPCALRYGKGHTRTGKTVNDNLIPGVKLLKEGSELLILSDALLADECLGSADILSRDTAVYLIEKIKPLDDDILCELISRFDFVISAEDGIASGGMGSAIAALMEKRKLNSKLLIIGWPDKFIEHGSINELRAKYGMDAAGIAEKAEAYIENQA